MARLTKSQEREALQRAVVEITDFIPLTSNDWTRHSGCAFTPLELKALLKAAQGRLAVLGADVQSSAESRRQAGAPASREGGRDDG